MMATTYDMWARIRISSAMKRAVKLAQAAQGVCTDTQIAFLEGAFILDDYNPHYFITSSGGRELPRDRKYYKYLGLKVPRTRTRT